MTYQPTPPHYPQGHFPPQYPVPPVPPKKSNTLKIILLVLAGIVVLCGIGGALGGKNTKTAHSQSPSAATAPGGNTPAAASPNPTTTEKPPVPGLNTPVRDGKFEFIVTDIQTGIKEVGTNPYLQKTAQGAYPIVSITVRNIGKSPYGFSPSDQYVYDAQNRKFANDTAAALNLQSDTSLYANLNPGNSITAQVVFDLPADSLPDHIVLHDSMFSGGATVSLR
ncbi:Non-specific serine/threonine protein kinase [Nocardia seriolae]|uniref:Non-specific serine/threonine protein kinase n=1 Tax=Nocardia seriolae TaxID=37332 RepID=A0ABC8AT18_9NOCA|nr:DUF4352 domain-containing protein [Nocardia seriolae]APA97278.1 Non-specific serine/threonine protein kinase [Nocardia seriolae]